jgi:hypothetical protein
MTQSHDCTSAAHGQALLCLTEFSTKITSLLGSGISYANFLRNVFLSELWWISQVKDDDWDRYNLLALPDPAVFGPNKDTCFL